MEAGKRLIAEGDTGSEFFVLLEGAVDVTREGEHVRRQGPGETFGEIALLYGIPRTASVTAAEPSRVLVLTKQAFRSFARV